jgi:hypothetical protein
VLFFEGLFRTKDHPEQAYRSCVGLLALASQYGRKAMEQACFTALERRRYNFMFVEYYLKQNHSKSSTKKVLSIPEDHQNVRGPNYYASQTKDETTP